MYKKYVKNNFAPIFEDLVLSKGESDYTHAASQPGVDNIASWAVLRGGQWSKFKS